MSGNGKFKLISLLLAVSCSSAVADVAMLQLVAVPPPAVPDDLPRIQRVDDPQLLVLSAVCEEPRDWEGCYEQLRRSVEQSGPLAAGFAAGGGAGVYFRPGRAQPEFVVPSGAEQVVELPPLPGGGALTLSGLLTLAGLQLARSARGAQLAALLHGAPLPEWYHPDAVQVGHSVPFDFQLSIQPLQGVFGFAVVPCLGHARSIVGRARAELVIRSSQHTPFVTAPRGPPALA